jgi:hypothetical protein
MHGAAAIPAGVAAVEARHAIAVGALIAAKELLVHIGGIVVAHAVNLARVTARVIGMPDLHNRARHRLAALVDHADLHMQRQAIPAIADIHALGRQRMAGADGGLAGQAATARQPGTGKRVDAAHGGGDGLGATAQPWSSRFPHAPHRLRSGSCAARQGNDGQHPQHSTGMLQPMSAGKR